MQHLPKPFHEKRLTHYILKTGANWDDQNGGAADRLNFQFWKRGMSGDVHVRQNIVQILAECIRIKFYQPSSWICVISVDVANLAQVVYPTQFRWNIMKVEIL